MAKKKLTLTADHIRLIEELKFETFVFDGSSQNGKIGWGIDQFAPWGGDMPIEDIAKILGHWNDFIRGTEENPFGRRYPEELEKHFLNLYDDFFRNFEYILDLAIKNVGKGLKPGTYVCNPRLKDWEYVEEEA